MPADRRRPEALLSAIERQAWPNGKIVEHWSVVDLMTILAQIGAVRAPVSV